ncbi:MAG TPA: hypothetical protein VHG51_14360, partial [Longimicrobiaceae bacterium]|nr:hypothetical protein [Longimicrobiaceae bacterium]
MRTTFRALSTAALLCAAALPAAAQEPQVSELQPAQVVTGSGDFTLVIRGTGFVPGVSRVSFGGRNLRDAQVTPGAITVHVSNNLITERVEDDFGDDGIARVPVTVLNGPASDAPRDRKILYVTRQAAVAPVRPPTPVVTAVGPSPAPLDGTLVITGQHLDAPALSVTLMSQDPSARSSSYNRDRHLTRGATEVRVPLAGVPAGSYTLRIDAFDQDRRELATIERPVVVGSPTRLGPPTIARYGPTPVRRGTSLWIEGSNFADDARVLLVPAGGGGGVPLARTPNARSSQTRLYVSVPANLPPGDFTVRVENPGSGTPAAEVQVAVQHPAAPAPSPGRGSELGGGWTTPPRPAPGRPR